MVGTEASVEEIVNKVREKRKFGRNSSNLALHLFILESCFFIIKCFIGTTNPFILFVPYICYMFRRRISSSGDYPTTNCNGCRACDLLK